MTDSSHDTVRRDVGWRSRAMIVVATFGLLAVAGVVSYHSGRSAEAVAQRSAVERVAASWEGPQGALGQWIESVDPSAVALLAGWIDLQHDLREDGSAARLASHVATLGDARPLLSGEMLAAFERDVARAVYRVAERLFAEAVADLSAVPRPGLAILLRVRDRLGELTASLPSAERSECLGGVREALDALDRSVEQLVNEVIRPRISEPLANGSTNPGALDGLARARRAVEAWSLPEEHGLPDSVVASCRAYLVAELRRSLAEGLALASERAAAGSPTGFVQTSARVLEELGALAQLDVSLPPLMVPARGTRLDDTVARMVNLVLAR